MAHASETASDSAPALFPHGLPSEMPLRAVFERLQVVFALRAGMVLAYMPRGRLQPVQSWRVDDAVLRAYVEQVGAWDRSTWRSMASGVPVRLRGGESGPRAQERLLQPLRAGSGVVVPLRGPVFDGYPGALILLRAAGAEDFADAELLHLADIAGDIDAALGRSREQRRSRLTRLPGLLCPPHEHRVFAFDESRRLLFPDAAARAIDSGLRRQAEELAAAALGPRGSGTGMVWGPDARGEQRGYLVSIEPEYPALAEGRVAFVRAEPTFADWAILRPADVSGDRELARLVPAIRYIGEQFARGITLNEVSRSVHLSPFHFHRRFTALWGTTPKHLMLQAQIERAKRELLARQRTLTQIAAYCGFAHQSHFTSRFRQATGMTPTRWRRMAEEALAAAGG